MGKSYQQPKTGVLTLHSLNTKLKYLNFKFVLRLDYHFSVKLERP